MLTTAGVSFLIRGATLSVASPGRGAAAFAAMLAAATTAMLNAPAANIRLMFPFLSSAKSRVWLSADAARRRHLITAARERKLRGIFRPIAPAGPGLID